jgi:hypothetical protein
MENTFFDYKEKKWIEQTTWGTSEEMNRWIEKNASSKTIKNIRTTSVMRLPNYDEPIIVLTFELEIEIKPEE